MASVDDVAPRSANGGTTPRPDPTTLTTDALRREIEQLRELLETKLETLDVKMTGHFFVDEQRFATLDERFRTLETLRVEQKRDTQEALTAALTAQKDAVAKQDEANQKAITKSDDTTNEKINKLEQLVAVRTDALSEKIDGVKETANNSAQQKVGSTESRTSTYALIGVLGTVIAIAIGVVSFALANAP